MIPVLFDLVRIVLDVVSLTTLGMCSTLVEDNLPWTVNSKVTTWESGGLCHIRYRALNIPGWAIEWRPTYQQYSSEASVLLRIPSGSILQETEK